MFLLLLFATSTSFASSVDGINQLTEMVPSFTLPLKLVEINRWRDGGSLGFKISGAKNNQVSFCYNGQIGSADIGFLFVGGTHASQKNSRKVTSQKVEHALMQTINIWVNQTVKKRRQKELQKLTVINKLNRTEFNAWTILNFLKHFETVRNKRCKKANKIKAKKREGGLQKSLVEVKVKNKKKSVCE